MQNLQTSFDRLASGKKLSSPIEDPGGLAVSMKLSASINRLAGAQNNVQNAHFIPGSTRRHARYSRSDRRPNERAQRSCQSGSR